MFAVSAAMQGSLLVMCFVWKVRQKKLGIDDFGITRSHLPSAVSDAIEDEAGVLPEPTSGTQTNGSEGGGMDDVAASRASVTEQTPLLERTPSGTLLGKDDLPVKKPWWKIW
jgi:hypothetical protein